MKRTSKNIVSPPAAEPAEMGAKLALKIEPALLQMIDKYIAAQSPQPTRFEAIRTLVRLGLETDQQRRREKKEAAAIARNVDAELARSDHAGAKIAEAEKTERLRKMRLAKEEHDRRLAAGEQTPRRAAATQRAKELAVGAVKESLAKIDAPAEEKSARKRELVAPPETEKIRTPK